MPVTTNLEGLKILQAYTIEVTTTFLPKEQSQQPIPGIYSSIPPYLSQDFLQDGIKELGQLLPPLAKLNKTNLEMPSQGPINKLQLAPPCLNQEILQLKVQDLHQLNLLQLTPKHLIKDILQGDQHIADLNPNHIQVCHHLLKEIMKQ